MNVLLLHTRKKVLPDHVREELEQDHLTVITEHGHVQRYGPDVDVRLVESVAHLDEVRAECTRVLEERRLDAVFAPFEHGQQAAGHLRSYFGIQGTGFDTVNAFSNKYVMKQRLVGGGLPVTDFHLLSRLDAVPDIARTTGWPVVVKPLIGGGSHHVHVLRGPDHYERFRRSEEAAVLAALTVPLVAERFVPMRAEHHLDGVVQDGDVVFAVGSRYLEPVLERSAGFGSCVLPDAHPLSAALRDLHAEAVRCLGLRDGVTHMEFFETDDGLVVGEIACRPAGGGIPEALRLHTGVDVWRAALRASCGRPYDATAHARGGVVAHVYLPLRPGRIVKQTPAAALEALPSVVQVEMLYGPGETVRGPLGSASASALVYLRVGTPDEAGPAVRRVCETYEIDVAEDEAENPAVS